jgi:ribose 5-phosphate isomerase A
MIFKGSKAEEAKRLVGYQSIDGYVKSGMVVGLGTGSTAKYAVERLGQKLKSGELKGIVAIPTSEATRVQALSCGIPITTLNEISELDVAIDGADQVDKNFNLVKGGGGALLREKMVEVSSKKFIVIVDDSKLVDSLGPGFPLPVEVTPFCHEHTIRKIELLPSLRGCRGVLRMGNVSNNKIDGTNIAITDNGNYIVDLHFTEPIQDPIAVNQELNSLVGVIEHGLFIQMADQVLVANASSGNIILLTPPST